VLLQPKLLRGSEEGVIDEGGLDRDLFVVVERDRVSEGRNAERGKEKYASHPFKLIPFSLTLLLLPFLLTLTLLHRRRGGGGGQRLDLLNANDAFDPNPEPAFAGAVEGGFVGGDVAGEEGGVFARTRGGVSVGNRGRGEGRGGGRTEVRRRV
jgi:hypothetical protein